MSRTQIITDDRDEGSGDLEITQALLNRGADARKICWPGKTALVAAIEHGYTVPSPLRVQ